MGKAESTGAVERQGNHMADTYVDRTHHTGYAEHGRAVTVMTQAMSEMMVCVYVSGCIWHQTIKTWLCG